MRGLKQGYKGIQKHRCKVAPPAGAWIETPEPSLTTEPALVAPPAGAWIETYTLEIEKHEYYHVAPPAGAWIETPERSHC